MQVKNGKSLKESKGNLINEMKLTLYSNNISTRKENLIQQDEN